MTSKKAGPHFVVNLEPILEELGNRGRYQMIQLSLTLFSTFLYSIPVMDFLFTGHKPDYQCNELNVTQLEDYLPDDVTNFTLHDVKYQKCSIDVTVNTSSTSSTHSLPCVAGVNFSMPSHTSFLTEWSLVCDKAGLSQYTQIGLFAGMVLASLVFPSLADRYGRKKVYISCALGSAITVNAVALAPIYYLFVVFKVIVGFFIQGMVISAYTMFVELFPVKWRSTASVLDSMMWGAGCIFLAIVGYCLQDLSWRYVALAFYSAFAFSLILPWFLEESLRWLVTIGRIEEAEKILKKACRMNGKDFDKIKSIIQNQISTKNNGKKVENGGKLNEGRIEAEKMTDEGCADGKDKGTNQTYLRRDDITATICSEESSKDPETEVFSAKYTVLDLVRHRVVFVPFLVIVSVWMTNNMYYYAVMLGSANLSGNRFLNFGLLNLQDFPSFLVCQFVILRFNRRPLAFTYGTLAGSFLLISVALIALGGGQGLTLTLATVAQYAGMFCLTGGYILLFVYYMEVYPTGMRAIGTGTAGVIAKITNMAAPFMLVWAEETPWAPGILLGCLCCLASLSIWLLPETRHRKLPDTIEEIQAWKKKGACPSVDIVVYMN